MRKLLFATFCWMLLSGDLAHAASNGHVVSFGKPSTVKLFLGSGDARPESIQVRPLYIDGKLKEFTTGEAHDITDRQFAVQRAYRVNDSLPGDQRTLPKWRWQRGAWLVVERSAGRVYTLRLPNFDPFYSEVAWYRDYAAYCGLSDTGEKLYAVIAQFGVHKPLVFTLLRPVEGTESEPPCRLPVWQREPARVTFALKEGRELTLAPHGHPVDLPAETPSQSQPAEEAN